jgi:hypothetical protein
MKKIIALLLVFLMIFALVACSNEEVEEENDDDKPVKVESSVSTAAGTFEYGTNDEGDYEITKYIPKSVDLKDGKLVLADVTLPKETADGRDIVGIGKDAFKSALTVKSITIPDTYTYIDDYAFYGCDNLKKVDMKDTVKIIGKGAFQKCPVLADLTLSKAITTVSADAFNGCIAITEVDLSGACTAIEKSAFFGCTELVKVTVSDKINYVSAYAFTGCSKLTYTVENGAKYLGNEENPYVVLVCAEALDIEECTVNDKTKVIAERAFAYCSALKKVTLGDGVKVIDGKCFENDPEFDKKFGNDTIPQVKLDFEATTYEFGCYLGTDSNPYMVLLYIIATNDDDFKLHEDTKIIADSAFKDSKIKDISYAGTEEDWNAIIKGENWNDDRIINVLWATAEEE